MAIWFNRKKEREESSLYVLFDSGLLVDEWMSEWNDVVAPFSEVVGFTSFGLILLFDSKTSNFAVLNPLTSTLVNFGAAQSIKEFEAIHLSDTESREKFLRALDLEHLRRLKGPLANQEVYFPSPFPLNGGTSALETYERGDIWVYLANVALAWEQKNSAK